MATAYKKEPLDCLPVMSGDWSDGYFKAGAEIELHWFIPTIWGSAHTNTEFVLSVVGFNLIFVTLSTFKQASH